jgi:hypothetical protein
MLGSECLFESRPNPNPDSGPDMDPKSMAKPDTDKITFTELQDKCKIYKEG